MSRQKEPKSFWEGIAGVYSRTFSFLTKTPVALLLFGIVAFLDLVVLAIFFFSHSAPISSILAPPIRRFYGERFLHYPDNFVLLPNLFDKGHFLLLTLVGLIVTGLVIKVVEADVLRREKSEVASVFGSVIGKYFPLLCVWLLAFGVVRFGGRWLFSVMPGNFWTQLLSLYLLLIVVQSLSAFLFASILISGKGYFQAIAEGFLLAIGNLATLIVILLPPVFLIVVISVLKSISRVYLVVNPELTLYVLVIGIFVSMFVDAFITVSTTLLYLEARNKKS